MPHNSEQKLRVRILILLVLSLTAFSTRLLPVAISRYPFNQDGLTECRIASDILLSGHLEYPSGAFYVSGHSLATPIHNVLIAYVAATIGCSPFAIAQSIVAVLSVFTVLGIFLVARKITGETREAVFAALVLLLLGTFVFLTASAWKASLGAALLVFLFFAYMTRRHRRMFAIEIVILAILPFVHHMVAVIGYLGIAYLTTWSIVSALKTRALRRRHLVDAFIVVAFSVVAYGYYSVVKLEKLSYVNVGTGLLEMSVVFLAILVVMCLVLSKRKHTKHSFAPIPATAVFAFFVWDHFDPLFQYGGGFPPAVLLLGGAICVLIGFAWFGFECIVESRSVYRALPIGMLLPVLTLFSFALVSGLNLAAHQTLYRSFDFADLSLAVGVSGAMLHFRRSVRATRTALAVVVIMLMVTFPFGYLTGPLTGVRHDTQAYEVDAIAWVDEVAGSESLLQSDERISYIAMALYDFEKMGYLPSRLVQEGNFGINAFYLMEDEWTTVGVNDYPRGRPVINETRFAEVLSWSNVLYVGGPASNNIIVYEASIPGQDAILGHH